MELSHLIVGFFKRCYDERVYLFFKKLFCFFFHFPDLNRWPKGFKALFINIWT